MVSDLLFIASTIFWCQKLETRTLLIYAAGVTVTAIGKWFYENT
jgi:hypothetical protein